MNPLDYHTLLALAERPLYGYAIREAIESDSDGSLRPRTGTLYRVLGRLLARGLVEETEGPAEAHPGRDRRYYALSSTGRQVLAAETQRLRDAARLAEKRLRIARERS